MNRRDILVLAPYWTEDDLLKREEFACAHSRKMFALIKASGMNWNEMNFEYVSKTENEWLHIDQDIMIKVLAKRSEAKVVIGLGQEILTALEGDKDLSKYRGSVFEHEDFTFIPTYHHTDVSKQSWKKNGAGRAEMASVFMNDFLKAVDIARNGKEQLQEIFNLDPSPKEIKDFVERMIEERIVLAGDIEGTGLSREHSTAVVLGLAEDKERAIVIPFKTLNGENNYSLRDQVRVEQSVQKLFTFGSGIVWQNGYLYDIPVLENPINGFVYPFSAFGGDTLLMQHALNPELPLNIGFLSSIWTQSQYWKESFLSKKEGIYRTDQRNMRLYNARDAVQVNMIREPLEEKLKAENLWDVYQRSIELAEVTMEMTRQGIPISQNRLNRWNRLLDGRLKQATEETKKEFNWGEEVNLKSTEHIRYILYGIEPTKSLKAKKELETYVPWVSKLVLCETCGSKKWLNYNDSKILTDHSMQKCRKCKEITVHLPNGETKEGSLKSQSTKVYDKLIDAAKLLEIDRPYQMPNFKPRKTDKGDLGTDNKIRVAYINKITKRLEDLKNFKRKSEKGLEEIKNLTSLLEFLRKLNHWAAEAKLKSTYSKFPTWADGRIHPSFLVHGTATGRLAGKDPNPQNFPTLKKEPELRKLFVAPKGYIWLSLDYEGLENFVLAYTAQDEELIKLLWSKVKDPETGEMVWLNLHDVNTKTLYNITPSDPMWGRLRDTAKIFQFSHIAYGGSLQETLRNMYEKVPDCGVTLKALKEGKQAYVERFKAVGAWQEETKRIAREERYVENAFGFKRTLFGNERDIEKQALNTPIQGGAAHIINEASKRIFKRMQESETIKKSGFNLQVHDENIFLVYIGHDGSMGELPEMFKIASEEMTKDVDFYGVPRKFRIDAEIGTSLGELYKFNPETFERIVDAKSKH